MPTALVDNDILAKGAVYSLLDEINAALDVARNDIGVLGSARYVLSPKRLKTAADGADAAYQRLLDFMNSIEIVEPSLAETALATELEGEAIKRNVQLDSGESQLCAIAITRATKWICTGDKRAILALETLRPLIAKLADLDHKLICLEALVSALAKTLGYQALRKTVCASKGTDKSLDICFQCHAEKADFESVKEGIASYLRALAINAPNVSGTL